MKPSHCPAEAPGTAAPPSVVCGKQDFLVFRLGDSEYGITLGSVQELCSIDSIARLDNPPAMVTGLLNLDGHQIPVADMHALLHGGADNGRLADVIVLRHQGRQVAIAVDCVIDVVTFAGNAPVDAPPGGVPSAIVNISIGRRTMTLLDLGRLLAGFHPDPATRMAA